jgi:hypothetical protein
MATQKFCSARCRERLRARRREAAALDVNDHHRIEIQDARFAAAMKAAGYRRDGEGD